MAECNYCTLQRIRRDAKKKGMEVTVLGDADWGMGGKNVYVHPTAVNIAELEGGEDGERKQYRMAWLMSIPDQCVC